MPVALSPFPPASRAVSTCSGMAAHQQARRTAAVAWLALGLVLGLLGGAGQARSTELFPLTVSPCTGAAAQQWQVQAAAGPAYGPLGLPARFRLENKADGSCLAVVGNESTPGGPGPLVTTAPCSAGRVQGGVLTAWNATAGAGDTVLLGVGERLPCPSKSGSCGCLHAMGKHAPAVGSRVMLWECAGYAPFESWTYNPQTLALTIRGTDASELCLDASKPSPAPPAGELLVSDDFDGPGLNTSVWNILEQIHRGGVYTKDNVRVEDGLLLMDMRPFDPPKTINGKLWYMSSGAVNTSGHVDRKYGRWQMRAKLPRVGQTPGFNGHNSMWLINTKRQEIDIFEQTGAGLNSSTVSNIGGNIHMFNCSVPGKPCQHTCDDTSCGPGGSYRQKGDFSTDFHIFQMDWRADGIWWSVDNQTATMLRDKATLPLMSDPLFFALTACVMDNVKPGPGDVFPQTYSVDWVKIWA